MSSTRHLRIARHRCRPASIPVFVVVVGTAACGLVSHPALQVGVSTANGQTQVQAGQAVMVLSTVEHSGGNPAVTWSLSGARCPVACGSLSSTSDMTTTYTAPPYVSVASSVIVTATAVADPSKSASVTLTLSPSAVASCSTGHEGALLGQYAFLVRGGGTGPFAMAGSFVADGAGHVAAGTVDLQRVGSSPATGLPVSPEDSGYWIGPDGRGCLAVATPAVTVLFRFALSGLTTGVSTRGRLIEFDDTNGTGSRAEGFLRKQDPAAFTTSALQGSYGFGVVGVDANGARVATVGVLAASGGTLTGGRSETNDSGVISSATAVSGTYAATASGRSTLVANGFAYAAYPVSSGELIILSIDAVDAHHPLQSGQLLLQPSAAFDASSLSARGVVYAAGTPSIAAVGLLSPGAGGNASLVLDRNDAGAFTTGATNVTYTVDADGRATLTSGSQTLLLQLVAANRGFLVSTDDTVLAGWVELQGSGALGSTTLSGTYSFGTEGTAVGKRVTAVGSIVFQGAADQVFEDDASPNGLLADVHDPVTTDSFPAGSTPGRGALDGSGQTVAYIISPDQFVYIHTTVARPSLHVAER